MDPGAFLGDKHEVSQFTQGGGPEGRIENYPDRNREMSQITESLIYDKLGVHQDFWPYLQRRT